MTDGRIPGKWVTEPRFAEMHDAVFGFLARAIAWSNEAGTDGHVKNRYLGQLHHDGVPHPPVYEYLENMGLWEKVDDGYQFLNWSKKAHHGGMGQSLAVDVANQKERNRRKVAAHRERMKAGAVTGDVTGYVTGPETGHVGQDRSTSSGSGSGSRDTQGRSLKTASEQADVGVQFRSDRQGTGDGDGDGDGDTSKVVEAHNLVELPADPGYCVHGMTLAHRCRQCPSGWAVAA